MNDSETALEHLSVIRRLMEKASVYRTVTVPTALLSGTLALLMSLTLYILDTAIDVPTTISMWLGIFVIVNAAHHGLIWRTARREGEPYLSPGLKMAHKAILPPIVIGGMLGLVVGYGPHQGLLSAVLFWILFYGLALLATSGFSPRSLRVLGLGFALVGSVSLAYLLGTGTNIQAPQRVSAVAMGLTFGLFHLIYGLVVWCQRRGCGETPHAQQEAA